MKKELLGKVDHTERSAYQQAINSDAFVDTDANMEDLLDYFQKRNYNREEAVTYIAMHILADYKFVNELVPHIGEDEAEKIRVASVNYINDDYLEEKAIGLLGYYGVLYPELLNTQVKIHFVDVSKKIRLIIPVKDILPKLEED